MGARSDTRRRCQLVHATGRTTRRKHPPYATRNLSVARALVLVLVLMFSFVGAVVVHASASPAERMGSSDDVLVITSKSKLKDIFECSRVHSIGSFNEYYVSCALHSARAIGTDNSSASAWVKTKALRRIEVQHVTVRAGDLSPYSGIHVELRLALNTSLTAATSIAISNSTIEASAIRLEATNITLDAHSHLKTTAQGLKFGPGFNSWTNMAGSYGGMGGAAISGDMGRRSPCEDIRPLDFYRAIGNVAGDPANFRGYGSGGGSDSSRGGGRIDVIATDTLVLNGTMEADGGHASRKSYDSAGAGGTVIVNASHVSGSGRMAANGGDPVPYDGENDSGGGGGGGGGRVVLWYDKLDDASPNIQAHPSVRIEAYGGGHTTTTANSDVQWCQLGGDGIVPIGMLLIAGRRLQSDSVASPVRMYGCTPLFKKTTRENAFLPAYVATVLVSGGTTLCMKSLMLPRNVSGTTTSFTIEHGSTLAILDDEEFMEVSAEQISIQSYVGSPSTPDFSLFPDRQLKLTIDGGDISLANALLSVTDATIHASGALMVDKFTTIKFHRSLTVVAGSDVQILGVLQPETHDDFIGIRSDHDHVPTISVNTDQSLVFSPLTAQIGVLTITLQAKEDAHIDLPFETPSLRLVAEAGNLAVSRVIGGGMHECKPVEQHADLDACSKWSMDESTSSPYLVSLLGRNALAVGNVTAGSIIACSGGEISIEGWIIADALGCSPNKGPGKSSVVTGASGGAGHGGKGGNVEPGNAGGGKANDHPVTVIRAPTIRASMPVMTRVMQDPETSWPIWPGSGAASGDEDDDDRSAQVTGGSGGGLIFIGAKILAFSNKKATISACGGDGVKKGGGGAGGAIVMAVGELVGTGVVEASGGESLAPTALTDNRLDVTDRRIWKPLPSLAFAAKLPVHIGDAERGGGGGGGGIVRTFFRGDDHNTTGNGDNFIKNGGKLLVLGGKGHGGEDGEDGVAAAVNCSRGRGGVLCSQCDAGTYSPAGHGTCAPCDPGSFSNRSAMAQCDKCAAGSFNPDFGQKSCEPCAPGSFAKETSAKKCTSCPMGSFADQPGFVSCALCRIGTISTAPGTINCTLCGIGETTRQAGGSTCLKCTDKPEHAVFNVRGNCTYACEKGRNGLECLTPFERLIKPIGGILGFLIIVCTLLTSVFASWGFITYRNSRDAMQRYDEYKAQTQRDELSLTNLTRNLTPRLTDQDLNSHLARLYFQGDNHLQSAWRLDPLVVPVELEEMVRMDSYESFARTCNQLLAWPERDWEFWMHRVMLVLVPPLSTLFLRQRQLHRVDRLVKYISQYTLGFFREMGFRVHGARLKVGFSPDFSLAYIDIVSSTALSSAPGAIASTYSSSKAGKEMTIVVAGSGSFFRPHHIDTNDVLVRAVPTHLELLQHQFWIEFIASVNQQLRLLPQPTSPSRVARATAILQDLCSFVATFNDHHRRDSIQVTVGTFSAAGFHALKNVDDLIASRVEASLVEHFKWAFRVTKSSRVNMDTTAKEPHMARMDTPDARGAGIEMDPRSTEFRYSRIRMDALFANSPSAAAPAATAAGGGGATRTTHAYDDDSDAPLYPKKSSMPHQRSRRLSRVLVLSELSDLLSCAPRSHSFQWLATVLQPVAPLFRLYNARPRVLPSHLLLPFVLLLLIALDVLNACWVLMEFYCVQVDDPTAHDSGCSRSAFVTVLAILPGALAGAPIFGLIFLSRKSILYGKLFAVWIIGSMVNLMVAIICALVYMQYIHSNILLVIVGGFAVKVVEKEIALHCIAQYTVERPLRGWRGLHTTKDWYDAAYTPLTHRER